MIRLAFFLCFCLGGLSSCSSDMEPSGTYVTGICRSCVPYCVRGSWYYPQRFYEYEEVGLASWYGPGFHKKPKASKELYNQWDLTAAHKTLPLPTIVRVTNLNNNRYLDVLVDDRGPYTYEGRIIDLSVTASKELGCHKKGLGMVRVESLVPQSKALSDYLAKNGSGRRCNRKRTWREVYDQEIAPQFGEFENLKCEDDDSRVNFAIKRTTRKPILNIKNRDFLKTIRKKSYLVSPLPSKRQLNQKNRSVKKINLTHILSTIN